MDKEHIAVELTESARNNLFVDSEIHGGLKIAGSGNDFIRVKIYKFKKEHPFWFWFGVIAGAVGIISGFGAIISWFL